MVKIWKIKFGNWGTYNVEGNNVSQAIDKVRIIRRKNKDEYLNRIQDITEVELVAEA